MKWSRGEIDRLVPILGQVSSDLSPVDGKRILVLCSATGEMALWLAEMMERGQVTGLELDPEALAIARHSAHEMGLEQLVRFQAAEKASIPMPEASFEALVSEFVVYPTAMPTEIGQTEMARVLTPGGRMVLTDVIVTRPLPIAVREALVAIGLDYLCEGNQADFRKWMDEAGLVDVEVIDLTPTVRQAWELRRAADLSGRHRPGYAYLLDDPSFSLGKAIFYIYVRGDKPHVDIKYLRAGR